MKTSPSATMKGQPSMERPGSRFLLMTAAPMFLMISTPNLVVCLLHFVVNYDSSVGEVFKKGFLQFWYDAWTSHGLGSLQTWTYILGFATYSALSIMVLPGKAYSGPPTSTGHVPVYRHTAVPYYGLTLAITSYVLLYQDVRCWDIYLNLPATAVPMVLTGFLVCVLLLVKGTLLPSPGEHGSSGNVVFDFYWGIELYPRIGKNFDVKMWIISRFGMMAWQLLALICWKAQVEHSGWNWAMAATAVMQTLYVAKFYWWEDGYTWSIDIIYDRAGYYLCWGCLCVLSLLFPITSLYMVKHSPDWSATSAAVAVAVGVIMISLTYWVDYQKQVARATNGKCTIWGSPARVVRATYIDAQGKQRNSVLLASGFWSLSRHMNYVFEVLSMFSLSVPAGTGSLLPHGAAIFVAGLVVHRIFRDDEKCSKKYKQHWKEYCSMVKYRLIPFIL